MLAFILFLYIGSTKTRGQSLQQQQFNSTQEGEVCLSKGCIQAAHDVLQNMDSTAKPCSDFYQFACGGFTDKNFIPDDKMMVSQFTKIDDELKLKLRRLITEEAKDDDPYPFTMTRMLYQSCTDTERIETLGLTEMKEIIEVLGGWPVISGDAWNPSGFDWKSSVYNFRRIGYSIDYFLGFSVSADVRNSSARVIYIDQPHLGMSLEYLTKGLKNKQVQSYYDYMVAVAELFGAPKERAKTELKESLLFEIKLAEFSLPKEERRNISKLYNRMTVQELSDIEPQIPWLQYMNRLLAPLHTIDSSEPVVVIVPSYFRRFLDLVQQTEKRVISNYAMWRVVSSSVNYLTDASRELRLSYIKAIAGLEAWKPRWKECLGMVVTSLPVAMGSFYVRHYFDGNTKEAVEEMVSDIRNSFNEILEEITWMDPVTKQRAKEKSKAIISHIAYPTELLDNSKLSALHYGLELNSTNYLRNMLNIALFATNYAFKKLREPVDRKDWVSHGHAAMINALYNSAENSIQFPAGILQGAFFDKNRPKYMNYGGVGFVIGHEITHGFDDKGRQFDKKGNLVDWWEEKTEMEFHKRAQCIIEQYGNYTVKEIGLNVNGITTQGENIADSGGIKEAYKAYLGWVGRNKKEMLLPGIPYSPDKMFWVSAANVFCSTYRKEALTLKVLSHHHPPARSRINGVFSNSEDFARIWNCPLGSPMNPAKKCPVW